MLDQILISSHIWVNQSYGLYFFNNSCEHFLKSPNVRLIPFLLPVFISPSFFNLPLIAVKRGRTSFHPHRKPFRLGLAPFVLSAALYFFSVFLLPCSTNLHSFVVRMKFVSLVWLSPPFSYPGRQKYFLLWISLPKPVSPMLKATFCDVDSFSGNLELFPWGLEKKYCLILVL